MRTNASFRLVVRFARRNTLFYDEDITALPRLVSAVYVGMKAMEISRYGQHDARSRLVRFSTELLKLNFQTRPKIWREQSCFYNELSALSPGWGGRDRTSEWRNQNPLNSRVESMNLLSFLPPFTHWRHWQISRVQNARPRGRARAPREMWDR